MGLLLDGHWSDQWYDTAKSGGRFERSVAGFRNWITADGRPGPSGDGGFAAESGRYHLYVSYACPWAHRTLIFRALKGLAPHITVDVVHPVMGDDGWAFRTGWPGTTGDSLHDTQFLREIYLKDSPRMSGRVTVPVLWDRALGRIVSNESAEIIRMFNSAFDEVTGNHDDYYPVAMRDEIDALNQRIYDSVNNGVYRAGFATRQTAYDEAVEAVFETLDWLEQRLEQRRFLTGDRVTEADWRLVTTLFRFDPVYVGHFKCNRRRLVDYPALWAYARALYQMPGIAETVRFDHITQHYYRSHPTINPAGIVPVGPALDWMSPHGRG